MKKIIFDHDSADRYDYCSLAKEELGAGVYQYELLVTSTTYDAGRGTITLDRKNLRDLFNVLGEELGVFN